MTAIFANDNAGCLTGINVSHGLTALQCENSTEIVWELVTKPVGSATTIAGATTPNASFNPDIAGRYIIKLCCYFDTENALPTNLPPQNTDLELPCPIGGIAGEEIFVPLHNCDGAVVWTVTGAITSFQGNTQGVYIQLDPLNPGTVSVSVTCTETDTNNNQTTTTLDCSFDTYDIETLECQNSDTTLITAEVCGTFCQCATKVINVKAVDDDGACEYTDITITIVDCTQPEEEVCE